LFGGLAAYARFTAVTWSIFAVRLRVDAGLLLIVLASIVLRQPFTLQYAREKVAREFWGSSEFVRVNYVLTAAWACAFAVMVAADLAMLYAPALPRWVSIAATVLAIYGLPTALLPGIPSGHKPRPQQDRFKNASPAPFRIQRSK
jgi:hypothetical protein